MISFLQKVLQKHHKWLFSILLVIVTISFVFTVGSSPGIGRNTRGQAKKIFGHNLSSQKEAAKLLQEVELSAQLKQIFIWTGQLQEYVTLSRLAALKLADDFEIPPPNKTLLQGFVENYPLFRGKDQRFDASKYNQFLEQFNGDPTQLSLFERTVADDFRISKIEALLSGQGYALGVQARAAISKDTAKYFFSTAKFDASVLPTETPYTEEEIKQYFDDNLEAYKVEEQIVLDYVEFSKDAFTKRIPAPTRIDLQKVQDAHKNQLRHLAEGSKEWRDALTKIYEERARERFAFETADQFVYDLYEKNITRNSDKLRRFIEDRELDLRNLGAITLEKPVSNEYFDEKFLVAAASLTNDRYYSDPIPAKNGNICVLLYRELIPAYYPALEGVREAVARDFLAKRREEIFSDQVKRIQKELAEMGPLTYEIFVKTVAEKGGTVTKNSGEIAENLTLSPEEKEALFALAVGSVSPVIFAGKMEAEVILLEKKEVPDAIDPAIFEQRLTDLEKRSKRGFSDYLIEMILDEMGVGENRQKITQQFRAAAALIHMQQYRDETVLY
ncbi:MAG: SurA N-terminal domain-containing protein [Puniceicoccales bacterium]|jgi:peptidyl-prolyl cis-trans isomerase D|nr:SurA N-terminal domain-containing protein [Puniceicoccales bacterium]